MQTRFVIFDFDGTLADSLGWLGQVMPETAKLFRFRVIGPENYPYMRSLDAVELIDYLAIPSWKIPFLAIYLRMRMSRETHRVDLFEGVEEMLHQLASGPLRFAVLSSNAEKNVRRIFGNRISTCFDHFQCQTSFLGKKARLKSLMAKSGHKPHETLFIGDEIRDLEAARKLDVPFGAVTWGFNNHAAFQRHQPDYVFHRVSDISELLLREKQIHPPHLPLMRNKKASQVIDKIVIHA